MTYDRWEFAAPAEAPALEEAGFHPLAARYLALRGIRTPEAAETLLAMSPDLLHDPFLLPDMDKAVERIRLAAGRNETVAVYGDYDADGVTAACVMIRVLREIGIRCVRHIPDRDGEGYGLNRAAIERLVQEGASLIVTVDTGANAVGEVVYAGSLGADVVITDHHACREPLPAAVAVVNPCRADSAYPYQGLAGVGVAWKLACALLGGWKAALVRFADLVALGTIADIMPVNGENRLLITQGLKAMERIRRPGLHALMAEAGLCGKPVTADTVAYILAPRINAAGRVGKADTALELLLTDDAARAAELSVELCGMNVLRQRREADMAEDAAERAEVGENVIFTAGEGWPVGVAGIVAARLAERFERPAFVVCLDGDTARGSARSSGGVDLAGLLSGLSGLLKSHGGHSGAAGFTLKRDRLDAFRQAVREACRSAVKTERVLEIDFEARAEWLDLEGCRSLEALSPFGTGFPPPSVCLMDAEVVSLTPMGGGKHLTVSLRHGGRDLRAVWFNPDRRPKGRIDAVFRPEVNRFRGQETPQLRIIDTRNA